jgi:hypothetical protein
MSLRVQHNRSKARIRTPGYYHSDVVTTSIFSPYHGCICLIAEIYCMYILQYNISRSASEGRRYSRG